jgi:hypothetical protein
MALLGAIEGELPGTVTTSFRVSLGVGRAACEALFGPAPRYAAGV